MPLIQGFDVDVDFIGRLATIPHGRPQGNVPVNQKLGYVVHYFGGAQNRARTLIARIQDAARWHTAVGRFGAGLTGAGLMYHAAIGEDGVIARCRDFRNPLWSAGSTPHNNFWIHIVLPHGDAQVPTAAQLRALDRFIESGIKNNGVGSRVKVIGHQEASSSLCPGVPLMTQFVRPIREGKRWTEVSVPVPEADHIIYTVPGIGVFRIEKNMYKRWSLLPEPLTVLGYPLSDMEGNDEDGYTQLFERARFEWLPGTWATRFDVHLARVGAELARLLYPDQFDNARDMFDPIPSFPDEEHRRHFSQTGHGVAHGFYAYWRQWGGVEYFGYPISREFQENGRTVQYFERARFEWHPEVDWHPDYHNVLLGRVAAEVAELRSQDDLPVVGDSKPISLESYVHVAEPLDVTREQLVNVCYAHGRQPVYTRERIELIADAILRYAKEFGFRASIVAAHIFHETGFFRFGGQVQPDQLNLAGLGADNTGAAGLSFPNEDEAVLAVFCHMALYVFGDTPDWPAHLQQYASKAIRRGAVAWADANVRTPEGTLLRYFGAVERLRDWVNGRWAQTDSVPLGTLENGYARALVRVGNEVIGT